MKVLARKINGIALAMTMLFSSVAFATVKTVTWKSSNKKVASVSKSGTVLTVRVGGGTYPAEEFCSLLGLRSQNFTAEHKDGRWRFTVRGCGHLVGMSQYGANEMAKSGSTAKDILLCYFPGTEIARDK